MAKKMSKGLIALSSAAIVSVYGAGYALTQPAAVSMAAGQTNSATPAAAAASDGSSPSGTIAPSAASSASSVAPTTAATAPSTSSNASGLKDGTYSGSGISRHGGVTVKVTVQNGRITAAPITGVTTRYSQSVIAGLPAQVMSKQSSQVNLVSGATDSSMAFQQAVTQALSQAGGAAATSETSSTSGSTASGGSVQVTGPKGVIYSNGGSNSSTGRQGGGRGY